MKIYINGLAMPSREIPLYLKGDKGDKGDVGEISALSNGADPIEIGAITFNLVNDTTLQIKVRGEDGVVRSTSLTLMP